MADNDGLLDTNIVVHALTGDHHSAECLGFLEALQEGTQTARLDPPVLHELTYALPRYARQMDRSSVADYLLSLLRFPGVVGDVDLMSEALRRWGTTPGLGFVDAYLATLATRDGCPVYTKNVRDFAGQGVQTPDPLPGA